MQNSICSMSRDPEVICDTELRKYALDLHRSLDAEPTDLMRLKSGNVAAFKEYAPAIGGKQARNKIEKRGLTGTVRADDGMRTTAGNAQIEFVDRGQAAKSLGQVLDS